MELFVFVLAVIFFLWLKKNMSADRPGTAQLCMEMLLTNPMGVGAKDLIDENIPHGGDEVPADDRPRSGCFVLFCNLISVFPTLESPRRIVRCRSGAPSLSSSTTTGRGIVKKGRWDTRNIFSAPASFFPGFGFPSKSSAILPASSR